MSNHFMKIFYMRICSKWNYESISWVSWWFGRNTVYGFYQNQIQRISSMEKEAEYLNLNESEQGMLNFRKICVEEINNVSKIINCMQKVRHAEELFCIQQLYFNQKGYMNL